LKSPASHAEVSFQPPAFFAQCTGSKPEPVDWRTVMVLVPPLSQIAAISALPSPVKSPTAHFTVSPQPPSRTAH
jgi:hypothetical protein